MLLKSPCFTMCLLTNNYLSKFWGLTHLQRIDFHLVNGITVYDVHVYQYLYQLVFKMHYTTLHYTNDTQSNLIISPGLNWMFWYSLYNWSNLTDLWKKTPPSHFFFSDSLYFASLSKLFPLSTSPKLGEVSPARAVCTTNGSFLGTLLYCQWNASVTDNI